MNYMLYLWHSNTCSKNVSQRYSSKNMKRHIHKATNGSIFIIGNVWKQPNYPSTGDWLNKLRYIHTVEHHAYIKRNERDLDMQYYLKISMIYNLSEKSNLQNRNSMYSVLPFVWWNECVHTCACMCVCLFFCKLNSGRINQRRTQIISHQGKGK